jgi:hypothetical protein
MKTSVNIFTIPDDMTGGVSDSSESLSPPWTLQIPLEVSCSEWTVGILHVGLHLDQC